MPVPITDANHEGVKFFIISHLQCSSRSILSLLFFNYHYFEKSILHKRILQNIKNVKKIRYSILLLFLRLGFEVIQNAVNKFIVDI